MIAFIKMIFFSVIKKKLQILKVLLIIQDVEAWF